jgi:DNA-binding transcriptional MerR regulator
VRISELARRSEVSVATIKFYLREGLLPEGELTSPTQAQYGDDHLARLRLIRALIGPGDLSIASARKVIAAIENPPPLTHDLLGLAVEAVSPPAGPDRDFSRVQQLMSRWGWQMDAKDCLTHAALTDALEALDAAGFELPEGALDLYAQHMHDVAEVEIDNVPTDSAASAVRYVVLGTVLVEPLLLALRRMAQQEVSGRRFGAETGVR